MDMQEEFFDKDGLLHPTKNEVSKNGILFLVEYYLLKLLNEELLVEDIEQFQTIISKLRNSNNTYSAVPSGGKHWSHDNHTAKCSFEYLFNLKSDIWLKDWYRRIHPRDLIFYLFLTPYVGFLA